MVYPTGDEMPLLTPEEHERLVQAAELYNRQKKALEQQHRRGKISRWIYRQQLKVIREAYIKEITNDEHRSH